MFMYFQKNEIEENLVSISKVTINMRQGKYFQN